MKLKRHLILHSKVGNSCIVMLNLLLGYFLDQFVFKFYLETKETESESKNKSRNLEMGKIEFNTEVVAKSKHTISYLF